MKQYSEPLALGRVGSQRTPGIRKRGKNEGKLQRQGAWFLVSEDLSSSLQATTKLCHLEQVTFPL